MRILIAFALGAAAAAAQDRPPAIVSPDVHADRTVTFRLRAPGAHDVKVSGDWGKETALAKDEAGVWSATLGPIDPDLYGYGFNVDGLRIVAPANTAIKPMRSNSTSILDVPGAKPSPCDPVPGVARGTVHLHDYESKALGHARRLRVYTPAAYDAEKEARFPVLFLLHGHGDNEATWTELGRANVILDNLVAAGKAKPMIVVMTDGHAVAPESPDRANNMAAYERDLLEDVMPLVESRYRVRAGRENRAIIGLSMGGGQSLTIGLNHADLFAWVGGMSSAVREPEKSLEKFLAGAGSPGAALSLLWFACGKDDFLLKDNQRFDAFLTEHKVKHEFVESAGNHSWPVWRRYLAEFAPKLFQGTTADGRGEPKRPDGQIGRRDGVATIRHRDEVLDGRGQAVNQRHLWPLLSSPEARMNFFEVTGRGPLHYHPDADHRLYVLEGRLVVTCGSATNTCTAGDFIIIPKGVPHCYDVAAAGEKALLLTFDAPPYDARQTVTLAP